MKKRNRFVFVAALLSIALFLTLMTPFAYRYKAIAGFVTMAMGFSSWALASDLHGTQWFTALVLPVMYAASVSLFYFLLPENFGVQIALVVLFGIGMYGALLTENIYVVAAIRTIQLVRPANAVGFILTIATAFFLVGTLFGFKLAAWTNGVITIGLFFPLFLQGFWAVTLDRRLHPTLFLRAAALSVIGGELTMVVSVLPMGILVVASLLSGYLYVSLGLVQSALVGRLFMRTLQEYIVIGAMVLIAAVFVVLRNAP